MALTLDGITQTLGGLVGALLGSYLSYRAATKTIEHDRNKQKILDIENFLKSAFLIERLVRESGLRSVEDIGAIMAVYHRDVYLLTDKIVVEEQKSKLNTLITAVTHCLEQISLIKDETIPQPVYESFVKIKWLLNLTITVAQIFLHGSLNEKEVEKDNFPVISRDLKLEVSSLLSYADERKIELTKLRKSSI